MDLRLAALGLPLVDFMVIEGIAIEVVFAVPLLFLLAALLLVLALFASVSHHLLLGSSLVTSDEWRASVVCRTAGGPIN